MAGEAGQPTVRARNFSVERTTQSVLPSGVVFLAEKALTQGKR